jgi:hypothetical protein
MALQKAAPDRYFLLGELSMKPLAGVELGSALSRST